LPSPAEGKRIDVTDLAKQLASSLGIEKATEEVNTAVRNLNLDESALDREGTLRVLELLAERPGLVGTVARFAKVRVILHFDQI
jgi:hypothetical protein